MLQMHIHVYFLLLYMFVTSTTKADIVEVNVDTKTALGEVSERYLSVTLGSSLIRERWAHWDFNSARLQTLAAGLSPAYLRLGGTDADFLIFEPNQQQKSTNRNRKWSSRSKVKHAQLDTCDGWTYCKPKYKTNFTMTAEDWDQINQFSVQAGWRLLFDFNVFLTTENRWSAHNARVLLDYSHQKGYMKNLDFELGNEPNAYFHNFNISMSGAQLGEDFRELSDLIHRNRTNPTSLLVGPDITRPKGKHSKSVTFLKEFLPVARNVVDAVTWHQYYVNGRTAVQDNFTDPSVLDLLVQQLGFFRKAVQAAHASDKQVWLGETSSAWGGGAKGLSDTYVAGFMWLDKLGLSAVHGVNTVMRQTFFRGHYALVDDNLNPRPDYWLSLLFKHLVGRKVLRVSVDKDREYVRMYAHCTNIQRSGYPEGSITLYGMNLKDEDVTLTLSGDLDNTTVYQYLLTPHTKGKLTSGLVRLNGKTLKMLDDTTFPPLTPKILKAGRRIVLPSKTFGFFVIRPVKLKENVCLNNRHRNHI